MKSLLRLPPPKVAIFPSLFIIKLFNDSPVVAAVSTLLPGFVTSCSNSVHSLMNPPTVRHFEKVTSQDSSGNTNTGEAPSEVYVISKQPTACQGSRRRGRAINWASDPSKDLRLLDWLDSHPRERDFLFSVPVQKGRPRKNCQRKRDVYPEVAKHFFPFENDHFRQELLTKSGRERLTHVIASSVSKVYKEGYARVLDCIGPMASRLPYEQIPVGSKTYQLLSQQLESFPIWPRLHKYWRELPQYNHFYLSSQGLSRPPPASPSPAPSSSASAFHIEERIGLRTREWNSTKQTYRSPSEDSDIIITGYSHPKSIDPKGEATKVSVHELTYPIVSGKIDQTTSVLRKRRTPEDESYMALGNNRDYELQMAEYQLKRAKIELEIQDKKTATEIRRMEIEAEERRQALEEARRKEQNRLLMHCMNLIAGGDPSKENSAGKTVTLTLFSSKK